MTKPMAEEEIEARYQNLYGRAAGYLPRNRKAADAWEADLLRRARVRTEPHVPSVQALEDMLNNDKELADLVEQTIQEALELHPQGIQCTAEMLTGLDIITLIAPPYTRVQENQIFFPMSALFRYMMAVGSGWDLFCRQNFNDALRAILKEWCDFLDSPASRSVLTTEPDGWLGQAAYEQFKLYEFQINTDEPYGGFASYNEFFHRAIKPEFRPNAAQRDPKAVVSPTDGSVVRVYPDARMDATITLKAQPYSLEKILGAYPDKNIFDHGDVIQIFLSGADYHRWHAPVDGVVEYVEKVPGLMFSELYDPVVDKSAGTLSQGYQANVNTRGIVVIRSENPDIGKVCVVPVGITEISSVEIGVGVNDRVARGDEIGKFSYGGSSMCLVFERGKVDFTVPPGDKDIVTDDGALVFVNSSIARAK
ncbi:phophatidylserine decarboxylase associated domain-containing protein [Streptomyces sp. AV19]|uniref:phosphatidylserine decarboxylase family protein n=1 Tax=Streptomyces sp. AV19 TaxID=2793068 RepID=UPI0018FEDD60|nr:phosphatidylserine decarboxylase family protein [Streptomyces sp. AV19]MBH1938567.1 phophatidylserine decarboxylase associated domain-containing protein [Streptomyces sp. AV19]MDG4535218.1 phosphatidylserine decarboxylase family protein [Streptomyces sp. AV19]